MKTTQPLQPAPPELFVSRWFNTATPIALSQLLGKVVAIHAFQMLCPGCVLYAIPQVKKLRETFSDEQLVVIGLHTVFEHHDVMTEDALAAFIHEYRLTFPIGVDAPGLMGPLPRTMSAWGLQGTPSLMLFDRQGNLRLNHFGQMDDMLLGSVVGQLLGESN